MKRALLAILFAVSACVGSMGPTGPLGPTGEQGNDGPQGAKGDAGRDGTLVDPVDHMVDVMSPYEEAVLLIHCEVQNADGEWEYIRGSGIKLEDGRYMTAAHVAAGPNTRKCIIYDTYNTNVSTWFGPENIAVQPNQDIAIASGFKWQGDAAKIIGAPIDRNYHVRVGEPVGLMSFPHSLTEFVVYTFGRVAFEGQTKGGWEQFGTDLVLFQGSSGGPAFNAAGNVIGVAAANYPDFNFDITYVQALREEEVL